MILRNLLTASALMLTAGTALATAACARAEEADFSNPYADAAPQAGLRFAALESELPTDPLLWSADPGTGDHHTPAAMLAPARAALRTAVPRGMGVTEAMAVLHKAGARCAAPSATALSCHYNDVETPNPRRWDSVSWKVAFDVADGTVGHMSLARDWSRR